MVAVCRRAASRCAARRVQRWAVLAFGGSPDAATAPTASVSRDSASTAATLRVAPSLAPRVRSAAPPAKSLRFLGIGAAAGRTTRKAEASPGVLREEWSEERGASKLVCVPSAESSACLTRGGARPNARPCALPVRRAKSPASGKPAEGCPAKRQRPEQPPPCKAPRMPTPAERAAAYAAEQAQEEEEAKNAAASPPKPGRHAAAVLARPRHTEGDLKRLAHRFSAAGRSGEASAYWRYGIELVERGQSKIDRDSPLVAALMDEVDKKMDKRMSRARRMELQRQRKKEKEARRKKALDEGDSLASNSTLTHHGKHHGGSLASDESSISTWYGKTLNVAGRDVPVTDVHAGQHHHHRTTSFYAQARLGYAKCGLCQLHFEQSSVTGLTTNKYIEEFREKGGLKKKESRRLQTPSYLYDEVKLCVFCTQLLSKDGPTGAQKNLYRDKLGVDLMGKTMKDDLKLKYANDTDESPNVLLGADCCQSSVCDGLDGDRAVDGDKNTFSRTQREKEAWWEAVLDPQSNPIREVIVTLVTPNRAPVHVFALLTSVGQGRLSDARKRCVEEFFGQGKRIVWTPSKPLRAAAVRIQVEGTHSLQIAAVEVFRAEGKQHKDDELHHFYDLMHTINEHQTQRTLDQIPSPLQEQSFFSEDTLTSRRKKVVATPQCGDKSAFFHEGTRSISTHRAQPTPVELSRVATTSRLSPALAARIKRHKQPSGFDSHEVDRMYWTTLLRYDHEAQVKDRRRSVENTFTSDQLTTARDLFASCSPHADERALASRDATPKPPDDASQISFDDYSCTPPPGSHRIEALCIDVSHIYTGLRKCASSLYSTAQKEEDGNATPSTKKRREKLKAGLFELLDANTCFSIASELYKLARLDEKFPEESCVDGELDDEHRGPLQLEVRWPAFLALLALIRDRSDGKIDGGYPRDVLDALDVHTDHRLVDPAATQRREDRDRSKSIHVDLGKQQERERKQKGTPSRRLQSRAGPRRRLPPSSVEEELLDAKQTMNKGRSKYVASQARFEKLAARLAPEVAKKKPKSHLEVLEMRKHKGEKKPVVVAPEYDYRLKQETRRQHQKQLIQDEIDEHRRPRRREKRLYNACGLCLQLFPSDSYTISAPHNVIIAQLKNFGLSEDELKERGSESLALWANRLPICVFCSQFLDPDEDSGIALRVRKDRDTTRYQPFFDAAYPDTYTETMRRKEARAAARRLKDDESTVVTHQSLPPAPAPAG